MYERDKMGRLKYNPELHPNHNKKFEEEDILYIIEWYEKIGGEEISFALGRTEGTIQSKVMLLRKKGMMPTAKYRPGQNKHYRMLGDRDNYNNSNSI